MTRSLGRVPCICQNCGAAHLPQFDAWREWVNGEPRLDSRDACLDVFDIDQVITRYGTRRDRYGVDREVQYVQLVEWKTHGSSVPPARVETLRVLDSALRSSFPTRRERGRFSVGHQPNWRSFGARRFLLYGLHVLQLSGVTPADSTWMRWGSPGHPGRLITVDELVGLLRFDLHPDSLLPIDHREHKRRAQQLQLVVIP